MSAIYRALKKIVRFGLRIVDTILSSLSYCYGLLVVRIRIKRLRHALVAKRDTPIKVAFLVIYDSVFPLERVFNLMREDGCFDVKLIVAPDVCRGVDYQEKVMCQTYEALFKKYGSLVLHSRRNGNFVDFSKEFDVFVPINPYSGMTHRYYQIPYLARNGGLVVSVRYFTDTGTVYSNTYNSLSELAYLWMFFAEDERDAKSVGNFQKVLRFEHAIKIVGKPKMDAYVSENRSRARKCIIIAPHHSIDPIGPSRFSIANFPKYANFFLSLPEKYPDIDWVFRPHPLTFRSMILSGRWSQEDCDDYIKKMTSFNNVRYEDGGDYLKTFADSDGLIQDCSSFLPEYFYTKKPQCYMLSSPQSVDAQFLEYGKALLANVYKAYSESDIVAWIENVILGGDDPLKEPRDRFATEHLMYNYPHASEALIATIKKELGRK